jgi:hypothetical protein
MIIYDSRALKRVLLAIFFLAIAMINHLAAETNQDYIDTTLPRDVPAATYEGEHYETEIPDTLDLVDHANDSINQLTRSVEPDYDYEQYSGIHLLKNPPPMRIGGGGLLNLNGKWAESLPGLRIMTGNMQNIEVDSHLIASLLHVTGKDGLCYQPIDGRPWAFLTDVTRKVGKPYCDIFGEGRQLLAFGVWYQLTGDAFWKGIADRKMDKLLQMLIHKEDTGYFRMGRGYTPWDENPKEGPIIAIADHGVYDAAEGMTGAPATYMAGFLPQAGANWYRLTGSEQANELGGRLARYLHLYGKMIDSDTGKFLTDHYTHITHSLLANLSYALAANDREMIKWVKRGFDFAINERDPDRTGILISDTTCSCFVADIINIGIMFSRSGEADYWELIDRWVRNTFVNLQIRQADIDKVKAMPVEEVKEGYWSTDNPGVAQFEDGADRARGGWFHSLYERGHTIGCCNGNLSRALYYIWDSIVEQKGDELYVNLPMNRASPWADVHSYLPYEGKLVVRMKGEKKAVKTFSDLMLDEGSSSRDVLIRIPDWTNWNEVTCSVNGEKKDNAWEGDRIRISGVGDKDRVVVEFPVRERTIPTTINREFLWEPRRTADPKAGGDLEVTIRGNTIVALNPDASLPLAHQAKYRSDKAPLKKVERFVSTKRFVW